MTPFEAWEARQPWRTARQTGDAIGVCRQHVHWLRNRREPPNGPLAQLMRAIDRLRELGEPWPPE